MPHCKRDNVSRHLRVNTDLTGDALGRETLHNHLHAGASHGVQKSTLTRVIFVGDKGVVPRNNRRSSRSNPPNKARHVHFSGDAPGRTVKPGAIDKEPHVALLTPLNDTFPELLKLRHPTYPY
jgi:hypothetical protein